MTGAGISAGRVVTDPTVDAMIRRISNWGRWGDDDELGTANLITPAVRRTATEAVVTGEVFSLAIGLDRNGPQKSWTNRLNPQHVMLQTGTELACGRQPDAEHGWGYADDMVTMALQAGTHWDALSHAFYDLKLYNDRTCELVTCDGASACGIETHRDSVVTRGLLLDVARALGHDHLPIDHAITVADIERTLEAQRCEVSSGDALLIRTGNLGRARALGHWDDFTHTNEPGLALDTLPWLHEHDIAACAADNWAFEAIPSGCDLTLPIHAAGIVHMGLLVGELFELDPLAAACAADGRYEFLLTAAPMPFVGAVGAPVNPIAMR